jgi:TM2 domain-containing membrane protein YozV
MPTQPPAHVTPPHAGPQPQPGVPHQFKSKTATAGLAFLFGWLGAHRFYLYGVRDKFAWLHPLGAILGLIGARLLAQSELASVTGWVLAIIGAATLLAAFLAAIVYGLRPDPKWDAQFNAGTGRQNHSGWTVVLIVILTLFIGASLLMGGLAQMFTTYFEHQIHAGQ